MRETKGLGVSRASRRPGLSCHPYKKGMELVDRALDVIAASLIGVVILPGSARSLGFLPIRDIDSPASVTALSGGPTSTNTGSNSLRC
jgi:hypothetical protein